MQRPQKITFAEMRASGVRGPLIYCSDYHCSHWTAISGDRWPDEIRLSDLEPRFTCQACGRHGADVRPTINSTTPSVAMKLASNAVMGIAMALVFVLTLNVLDRSGIARLIDHSQGATVLVFVGTVVTTFGMGATLTGLILIMTEDN